MDTAEAFQLVVDLANKSYYAQLEEYGEADHVAKLREAINQVTDFVVNHLGDD